MNNNIAKLKKSSLFHVLIIATLAIGLYSNTLKNSFVYDDEFTIVNNTLVKSFENLPLLFDKTAYFSRSAEKSYRPVVTFTYFIDYAFYGLKPWGYHLTNIMLHAVNGALLYYFLTLFITPSFSRLSSPAFLISILFVFHPVLTEAVNCISYREDLLAFLFYITTLSLYLILRTKLLTGHRPLAAFLYLLSCLTYILALLSKEMAVTLPLIVFCYEWLYGKEKILSLRRFNRYAMGYVAITLFYLYLRFYLFHNPKEQIQAWSLVERFLTLPWFIVSYIKLSLFPVQLSADYVINPVSSPFSIAFILPVIALIFIFTIILLYLPFNKGSHKRFPPLAKGGKRGFENGFLRQRSILFGALFFIITLTPVYNLVPIPNPSAERYLYLPLAGFVIFANSITNLIITRETRNPILMAILIAILSIYSLAIVERNKTWMSDDTLWSDAIIKMPDSYRAYNNLGIVHYKKGQIDKAIENYNKAIALNQDIAGTYTNLGNIYYKKGQIDRAVENYNKAIALNPNNSEAYNNLGAVYDDIGQFDRAIENYNKAIALNSNDAEAYNNLGNTYKNTEQFDKAVENYNKAILLNPNYAEGYNNLGVAYVNKGVIGMAIFNFQKACTMGDEMGCKNLQKAHKEQKGE